MPHQCTECGYTFPDGSKEMLSGCPECGGNKFQYHRDAAPDDPSETTDSPPERPDSVSGAVGRAADTVRDVFGSGSDSPTAEESSSSDVEGQSTEGTTPSTQEGTQPSEGTTPAEPDPSSAEEPASADADTASAEDDTGTPNTRGWPDPDGAAKRNAGTDPAKATGPIEEPDADAADATTPDEHRGASDAGEPTVSEADSDKTAGEETHSEVPPDDPPETGGKEDRAQADARSQVVDEDDLPDSGEPGDVEPSPSGDRSSDMEAGNTPEQQPDVSGGKEGPSDVAEPAPTDGEVAGEPDGESPELSELREELNSQFESIRIVEPGQYELNLMELYDRDQYIIALQEDGRYVIEVPEAWREE